MPKIFAKKIGLIRTSAIGDTVHALAFVNGLRKGFPEAQLTWILQNLPYEMVKHQKNIDRFIVFNRRGSLLTWRDLIRKLRSEHFDLLLMPQVSIKAGLISLFTRADIKLGFDKKRSREGHWLFTNTKLPAGPIMHAQDLFFEFLKYLEITPGPPEWNFTFTPEELKWQAAFFDRIERPVVSFVVATSNPQKNWSPDGYAAVIDYVDQHLNLQAMIVGGPSAIERAAAEKIKHQCQTRPIVALEKPIRKTMLQLGGSTLVVAPDTGPLHIAVALGVPTIGLYGFSDPRRCGPYRKYQDLLIDKYSAPGRKEGLISRQTRPNRMPLITPDDVIAKIELALCQYIPEVDRSSSRPTRRRQEIRTG